MVLTTALMHLVNVEISVIMSGVYSFLFVCIMHHFKLLIDTESCLFSLLLSNKDRECDQTSNSCPGGTSVKKN